MNFGKYKNTSIKEILEFDLQYILWCIDNINNLMQRIDEDDKKMLRYLFNPFEGINLNITNANDIYKILSILKERGIVQEFQDFVDSNRDLNFSIDTIYGYAKMYTADDGFLITESKLNFIKSKINRWVNNITTKDRISKIF